jgi:hypothetical protein
MKRKKIIVDPNKPLPPALAKEYWEISAKLILEYFFPERFANLSVDDESPDLQNNKTGIEVTSAECRESQEIDGLYIHRYLYGNKKQKEKALKHIKKLGGRVEKYFLAHPGKSRNLNIIYEAIDIKTQKLNTNYKIFTKNYLFIYNSFLIIDQELSEMLSIIAERSMKYTTKFDSVFLYCLGGDLYEFNLLDKTPTHIANSGRIAQQLVINARHIIDDKYRG